MKRFGLMKPGRIICTGRYKIRKLSGESIFLSKILSATALHQESGEPEPLKENLKGYYSRRINAKDRLYKMQDRRIYIAQCRGQYDDR